MAASTINACLLPQRQASSIMAPVALRQSVSRLQRFHPSTRILSKTVRGNVLVSAILQKVRTIRTEASGDVKNVELKIYSHRSIKAGPLKDIRPHITLQVVSEDPTVPLSDVFTSDDWAAREWDRSDTGVEDPGSIWFSKIQLPTNFGTPGALLVTNEDAGVLGRIYISKVNVGGVTFHGHTMIDRAQGERVFFSSVAKLPQETPEGIKELRQKELYTLQGKDENGKFIPTIDDERKVPERIYQYDVYNDLSNPGKSKDLERPTLGGSSDYPFPRRLRTNRGLIDNKYERDPPLNILGVPDSLPYLPLDERFNETKIFGFVGNEVAAALAEVPAVLAQQYIDKGSKAAFRSFHAVDASFTEPEDDDTAGGQASAAPKKLELFKRALDHFEIGVDKVDDFWQSRKFPVPKVRDNRQLDWASDEEFGRQFLAGQNPVVINQVTKQWLDQTPFTDASIEGLLDGKKLSERVGEEGKLFYVDYVPGFEDYIERINAQVKKQGETDIQWLLKPRFQHAARALFYFTDNGYLMPVAVEVRKEKGKNGAVYTPYDPKELWQLAKSIIASLDSAFHQVVSHYLRAHACQEPFILATMRNVSALHPVFKLMVPHFRYTLDINANARSILVNANGLLEQTFTTGRYTMEIGSWAYKHAWQFKDQGLENNLIARRMVKLDGSGNAVRDDKGRVIPVVDYPYAQDGLDIWYAMRAWFGNYLGLYYKDGEQGKQVTDDKEIMAWWKEIREEGHPDKQEGWPELHTVADLTEILTTIAYNGSAHHAAVNFGQYDYSGYVPNRPSFIRKPIPEKGSAGVEELQSNYEEEILSYINNPADATQLILLYNVLSAHASNEEYLDHETPEWIEDQQALAKHADFIKALKALDDSITERNKGDSKIRGKKGARGLEYTLLRPHSEAGVTMRGVPCSTSI